MLLFRAPVKLLGAFFQEGRPLVTRVLLTGVGGAVGCFPAWNADGRREWWHVERCRCVRCVVGGGRVEWNLACVPGDVVWLNVDSKEISSWWSRTSKSSPFDTKFTKFYSIKRRKRNHGNLEIISFWFGCFKKASNRFVKKSKSYLW